MKIMKAEMMVTSTTMMALVMRVGGDGDDDWNANGSDDTDGVVVMERMVQW
jgi:hypothetical protein